MTSGDVLVTLSVLERAFLRRLEAAGLPVPHTNRPPPGAASTAAGPTTA